MLSLRLLWCFFNFWKILIWMRNCDIFVLLRPLIVGLLQLERTLIVLERSDARLFGIMSLILFFTVVGSHMASWSTSMRASSMVSARSMVSPTMMATSSVMRVLMFWLFVTALTNDSSLRGVMIVFYCVISEPNFSSTIIVSWELIVH